MFPNPNLVPEENEFELFNNLGKLIQKYGAESVLASTETIIKEQRETEQAIANDLDWSILSIKLQRIKWLRQNHPEFSLYECKKFVERYFDNNGNGHLIKC